ncbi:MAG: methyltransferase domain-containing protein [Spongiibacteraceae bacterium]|jgi:spermidine synthase|nr:methyltransferase domain-containing protein [Spongiibacteraceae bacterium]
MSDSPLGREIYRTYDEFGPIHVFEDGEHRYLSFGEGEEQSCVSIHQPHVLQHEYTQAMLLPLLFRQPERVLLLGLGGGALATALLHALPKVNVTAVELRRAVIKAARRFFQLPTADRRLQVIQADAGEFVETAEAAGYDLLCSDIYNGEGMAMQYFQPWFIAECRRLLTPDGWLVLNCWDEHRGEAETMAALDHHFGTVYTCAVKGGNWIIFASCKPGALPRQALRAAARSWGPKLGFSFTPVLRDLQQRVGEYGELCTSN